MNKVLIISYFFPPCNLPAAQRTFGWANYLNDFGYYPVIITRNWDIPIQNPQDTHKPSGKETIHKKNEKYEVFYLPYHGSLRDRLFVKHGDRKFIGLRRILTFLELFFQNFIVKVIPYSNLYFFSSKYLKENPEIKKVIITANPFILFRFGYLLQKKLNIHWIADYRDDWNTSEVISNQSFFNKILSFIESKKEKKWVKTASFITSVSKYYAEKISKFVTIKGVEIINGFEKDTTTITKGEPFSTFTLLYNGTLYDSQPIEIFLNGYKSFIDQYHYPCQLLFPGLAFDTKQKKRVEAEMFGYEKYYTIYERLPRAEVLKMQGNSHAFILISHNKLKGIPSSKMYEYLGFEKPIILCPSDNNIIEDTLMETGLGMIAENKNEIVDVLNSLFQKFKNNEPFSINPLNINKFNRGNSTKLLAEILDEI